MITKDRIFQAVLDLMILSIYQIMIRRLALSLRFTFAKYKEANPTLGGIDDAPDLKNKALDRRRRFDQMQNYHLAGQDQPNFANNIHDLACIERNQIETRILRVIRDLEILKVKDVDFKADLRGDLRVDSLNMVALLTSIEHEFTTVFEDNFFEGVKTLDEVVTVLSRDPKLI